MNFQKTILRLKGFLPLLVKASYPIEKGTLQQYSLGTQITVGVFLCTASSKGNGILYNSVILRKICLVYGNISIKPFVNSGRL